VPKLRSSGLSAMLVVDRRVEHLIYPSVRVAAAAICGGGL
jgi:hypothetical protein